MLIITNSLKNTNNIQAVSDRFDLVYLEENITSDIFKAIVKDVDSSDIISGYLIQSPVLGPISPKDLSTGVKSAYIMLYDIDFEQNETIDMAFMGDNVLKWIGKIANQLNRDVVVYTDTIRKIPENVFTDADVYYRNEAQDLKPINSRYDFVMEWETYD